MIKAIIFDFFGVLVTEGWLQFAQQHFAGDAAVKQRTSDMLKALGRGMLSYDDFARQVAELAGVPEAEARQQIFSNAPNDPLFDYIRSVLKPNYKLGILSNTGANRLHELLQPEQIELFDAIILSYEHGIIKPEPEAYRLAADRLGVGVEECVFIDDQEKHCIGARNAGMKAIRFESADQLKRELEKELHS